ncbi:MAG: hypothetical protein V4690_01780 [Patescibacteria group bacterium]
MQINLNVNSTYGFGYAFIETISKIFSFRLTDDHLKERNDLAKRHQDEQDKLLQAQELDKEKEKEKLEKRKEDAKDKITDAEREAEVQREEVREAEEEENSL